MSDELGRLIREGREKKGYSQLEVSQRLKWGRGSFFSHLENATPTGKGGHARVPNRDAVEQLAEILGVSYKKLALAAIERVVANRKRVYFGK